MVVDAHAFVRAAALQLRDHVGDAVLPLIGHQDGVRKLAGSATVLRAGEAHLVVTASHVAKVRPYIESDLCVHLQDGREMSLAGEVAYVKDDDACDIAVVRLEEDAVRELVADGRTFATSLDLEDLPPRSSAPGWYAVLGFPEEKFVQTEGCIHYGGAGIICTPYSGDTSDLDSKYTPDAHLLLSLPENGFDQVSGAPTKLPLPQGMSGGSVWWIGHPREVLDDRAPGAARWVGVQGSVYPSPRRLKVTRWAYVEHVITKQWPDLVSAFCLRGPARMG